MLYLLGKLKMYLILQGSFENLQKVRKAGVKVMIDRYVI